MKAGSKDRYFQDVEDDLQKLVPEGIVGRVDYKGTLAEVNLNDGDLLCLREICQSYIRIGEEPVGYNLKRKIYMALYGTEYKLGRQLDDVLGAFTPDRGSIPHPSSSRPEDENFTGL